MSEWTSAHEFLNRYSRMEEDELVRLRGTERLMQPEAGYVRPHTRVFLAEMGSGSESGPVRVRNLSDLTTNELRELRERYPSFR